MYKIYIYYTNDLTDMIIHYKTRCYICYTKYDIIWYGM